MRKIILGVEKSAEIVDSEGHAIGKVHEIIYNDKQEISQLIIQKGLVFKTDIAIPHDAIDKVEDGKIQLTVTRANLSALLRPDHNADTVESEKTQVNNNPIA